MKKVTKILIIILSIWVVYEVIVLSLIFGFNKYFSFEKYSVSFQIYSNFLIKDNNLEINKPFIIKVGQTLDSNIDNVSISVELVSIRKSDNDMIGISCRRSKNNCVDLKIKINGEEVNENISLNGPDNTLESYGYDIKVLNTLEDSAILIINKN